MHSLICIWALLAQLPAPTDGAIIFEPIDKSAPEQFPAYVKQMDWPDFTQIIQAKCNESKTESLSYTTRERRISISFPDGDRYASIYPELRDVRRLLKACGAYVPGAFEE